MLNNPVNFVDPWGLCGESASWVDTFDQGMFELFGPGVAYADDGLSEFVDNINWKTVGIGGVEFGSGVAAVVQAAAVETLSGGAATPWAAARGLTGVTAIGVGIIDIILGFQGKDTLSVYIQSALKEHPLGNRLYQNVSLD